MRRNRYSRGRRPTSTNTKQPRPVRRAGALLFLATFVLTVGVAQAYFSGWFAPKAEQPLPLATSAAAQIDRANDPTPEPSAIKAKGERIDFSFCHAGGGENCIVDGDTIWLHGTKIRLADIDTPETHNSGCSAEKELGDRATERLHQLLESGPIELRPIDRDEDRYGRKLRIINVNGQSVGDRLVEEGLARRYDGGRRPWC